MPLNFEPGQGVMLNLESGRLYGLVTACDGGQVEFAPVRRADRTTRCFDEGGSKYDTDRYKVRPRGCPPPFTLAYGFDFDIYGAYIDARPIARQYADERDVASSGLTVVDDGEKVSAEVLANTLDPVWRDEKEGPKRPWEDPEAPVSVPAVDRLNRELERNASAGQHGGRQFGD